MRTPAPSSMKTRKIITASLLALTSTGLVGLGVTVLSRPAHAAGLVVFDPSNYSQTLLTAARTLQQINNQIQSLQNEATMVPAQIKVALIDLLTDAGMPGIEATSFVSPKWVPQMSDAADVMARIRRKPGVRYSVLTPNMQGYTAGVAANADEVAVFVAASETFSRKNINCTIAESLARHDSNLLFIKQPQRKLLAG